MLLKVKPKKEKGTVVTRLRRLQVSLQYAHLTSCPYSQSYCSQLSENLDKSLSTNINQWRTDLVAIFPFSQNASVLLEILLTGIIFYQAPSGLSHGDEGHLQCHRYHFGIVRISCTIICKSYSDIFLFHFGRRLRPCCRG